MNFIFANYSLIIFTAKCNFVNSFCEDFMIMTSYDIHASHMFFPCEEAVFVIFKVDCSLHFRLLNPFTLFLFFLIYLKGVKFRS